MHHNGGNGLDAEEHAVVELYGTTPDPDIRSNKKISIGATDNAKVNIHLPSQHNP